MLAKPKQLRRIMLHGNSIPSEQYQQLKRILPSNTQVGMDFEEESAADLADVCVSQA